VKYTHLKNVFINALKNEGFKKHIGERASER
jgi:hypothetical protein